MSWTTSGEKTPEHGSVVAEFSALMSVELLTTRFRPKTLNRHVRAKLEEPPGYATWPSVMVSRTGVAATELSDRALELMCMRTLLDFAAGIDGASAHDLDEAIGKRWPGALAAQANVRAGKAHTTFAQTFATAQLFEDGYRMWGYEPVVNAGDPVPLDPGAKDLAAEFDMYVQNHLRLAVQRQLEDELRA